MALKASLLLHRRGLPRALASPCGISPASLFRLHGAFHTGRDNFGQSGDQFETVEELEKRLFGNSEDSKEADPFYRKLDELERAGRNRMGSRWNEGRNSQFGNGLGGDFDSLSDGMDEKLDNAARSIYNDEIQDEEDYKFRPYMNFMPGDTYTPRDLDLTKPTLPKPFKREEFETTTEEVLKKADFPVPNAASNVLAEETRGHEVFTNSYVALLSEEDPSKPLCEVVKRSHIRPPPPPVARDEVYPLHARVGAFHTDGWWSGIVSAVIPAVGRYTVCVPTSREEIEFAHSELRPQLHWVSSRRRCGSPRRDGKDSCHFFSLEEKQNENQGKPKFKVGEIVEVSRDREKYGVAWFDATIVKEFDINTFLVQYDNVKSHSNNELLEEILDIQYMRPGLLASSMGKDFTLGDEVEALVDHGWSAGTILEILDDAEYVVELKHSKEKLKFDLTEMRYPRIWTGFHWVLKNKKPNKRSSFPISPSMSSGKDEVAKEHNADTIPPSSCKGEVAKGHNGDTSSIKWTNTKSPTKTPTSEGTAVVYKPTTGTSSQLDSIEIERGSVLPTGMEIEKRITTFDVENDSSMEKQQQSKSSSKILPHVLVHRDNSSNVNDISQVPLGNQLSISNSQVYSRHEAETLEVNYRLVPIEHDDSIPIARWSTSKCFWDSKLTGRKRSKRFVVNPKRRKLSLGVRTQLEFLDDSREQSQNQIIGKTGDRPPDMRDNGTTECDQCELENPENSLVVVESGDRRKEDHLNQGVVGDLPESGGDTNISTPSRQVDPMDEACLTPHVESHVSCSMVINSIEPQPSDVRSCSLKTEFMKASVFGSSLDNNAIITFENQVTASPCENGSFMTGMHMDPTQTRSFEVCGIENQGASVDAPPSALPPKKAALPFVKSLLFWESVESMDIFKQIPQQPHFSRLKQYSINFREGMALGLMISFAQLVSSIEKLSISDDSTLLEEMLGSLEVLEENGFNVSCVRTHLKELLQLQIGQKQNKSKKTMLEAKMVEIKNDCDMNTATITSYDNALETLEGNIARIHEEKDAMMKAKEMNDSSLVMVKREAQEAEEVCRILEERFSELTAPW